MSDTPLWWGVVKLASWIIGLGIGLAMSESVTDIQFFRALIAVIVGGALGLLSEALLLVAHPEPWRGGDD